MPPDLPRHLRPPVRFLPQRGAMAQVFPPVANSIARVSILGAAGLLLGGLWIAAILFGSPWVTRAGIARPQPVPFSHTTHVGTLGMDCRFCHTAVEESTSAGLPPTKTCMTCHSQILAEADVLAPVRKSFDEDRPLRWTRVHDLPDFVRFDHSAHVHGGVACVSCHGRVDQMPRMAQGSSLQMDWCLDCHRHPERAIRTDGALFDPTRAAESAGAPTPAPPPDAARLTNCSTCHQ